MNDSELVHEFLDSLADGRIDAWVSLLTDDVVADTPFAPDGSPKIFEGIEAVNTRFGDARTRMQSLRFFDRAVYTTHEGPLFVTCKSEGVRGDGGPYRNSYCWQFTIVDGRVSHWVEFFDPQEVIRVRS